MQSDYEKPLAHVHFRAEGDVEFRSLLYIPDKVAHCALGLFFTSLVPCMMPLMMHQAHLYQPRALAVA